MIIGIYSAPPKHGWGHIRRCEGLAGILLSGGHVVFTNFSQPTIQIPIEAGIELDWLVVDHPDESAADALGIRAKKQAYLHGNSALTRPKNWKSWDLIVVQGVTTAEVPDRSRWAIGLEYAMIRPEVANMMGKIPRPPERRLLVYPVADMPIPSGWDLASWGTWFYASHALVRFGMISLELACLGIPQVIVGDDNIEPTAFELVRAGAAVLVNGSVMSDEISEILEGMKPIRPRLPLGSGTWHIATLLTCGRVMQ